MDNNNTEDNKGIKDMLGGNRSILNVDAQKELVDYTLRAGRKNALVTFFIVFPVVILFVAGIMFLCFHFLGAYFGPIKGLR